ncbi:MAG: efflux RND transporter periplasmic adaptor subunit [Janthinobacterium lividum]
MKQVASSLAASLLCLLVAASACNSKSDQAAAGGGPPGAGGPGGGPGGPAQVLDYGVLTIQPRTAELHSDYPTVLQGQADVEIRPKVEGFIDQVLVDEGAHVRKGQLLFRLNSDEADQQVRAAQSAVLSAQADVTTAQLDVSKTEPLVADKILSAYTLNAYRATLQAKKALLAQSRASLIGTQKTQSYTRITSPVDGVIGTLPYKLGSLVNATSTQPLTTVSSNSSVRAYFSINEKDALTYSEADKGLSAAQRLARLPRVQLVLANGQLYQRAGRVEAASGLVNSSTGSVQVRADFPNPDGLLHSGATGRVRVPQTVPNALLVPQAATYELQGKRFVYVVGAGNEVVNTAIDVLPLTNGLNYVVSSGLKAGDQIVTEGVNNLQDGQAIKPRPVTAATATATATPAAASVASAR